MKEGWKEGIERERESKVYKIMRMMMLSAGLRLMQVASCNGEERMMLTLQPEVS